MAMSLTCGLSHTKLSELIVAVTSFSATIVSAAIGDTQSTKEKGTAMSTETLNQQIPAGTWSVDPVHSAIHFAITHNRIATFRSGFKDYAVTLTGGERPRLEGSVEVASIEIDEAQLKGHLLS